MTYQLLNQSNSRIRAVFTFNCARFLATKHIDATIVVKEEKVLCKVLVSSMS